jgi:hypothetical protein
MAGGWYVPDHTTIDGAGAGVVLTGPGPTLSLGSGTVVRKLTIERLSGPIDYTIFVYLGSNNLVELNTLIGGVMLQGKSGACSEPVPSGNELVSNTIVSGYPFSLTPVAVGIPDRMPPGTGPPIVIHGISCGIRNTVIMGNGAPAGGLAMSVRSAQSVEIIGNNLTDVTVSGGGKQRIGALEIDLAESTGIHITANNFSGGAGFGLTSTAGSPVRAEGNWWGAASGPSGVGAGSGKSVSEGVIFAPWSQSQVTNDDVIEAVRAMSRPRSSLQSSRQRSFGNSPASAVRPPSTGDAGLR